MSREVNRWKGFVLGALGGAVGVLAMDGYWKAATTLTGEDPRQAGQQDGGEQQAKQAPGPLDDISLVGKQYKEGESSTAAMGRIVYTRLTGKEPQSDETKNTLSYLAHWVFSMAAGALYGALRGSQRVPDIPGGLMLSVALWGPGDEIGVALLGLTKGPTAYPPQLHAHSLGAHVAYGLTTAATAQVLDKAL
jgi:hypothetical protein